MTSPRIPHEGSGIDDAVELFEARLDDFVGDIWEGRASMPQEDRVIKVAGVILELCELLDYIDHRTSTEVGGTADVDSYLKRVVNDAVVQRKVMEKPENPGPTRTRSNVYPFLRLKK
jgi:hypothetical protein